MSSRTRNVLLDTHALLWWVSDDKRLSGHARDAIAEAPRVAASHASLWELAVKCSIGKLALEPSAQRWFAAHVAASRFAELPVSADHLGAVEHLPLHHRDPFDRLLICQAQQEGLGLVTADQRMAPYDVDIVW